MWIQYRVRNEASEDGTSDVRVEIVCTTKTPGKRRPAKKHPVKANPDAL